MTLVDTHTHLYAEEFDADRDAMLQRAKASGINALLLPNVDSQTLPKILAVCQQTPSCYPMLGLHPTAVKADYKEQLAILQSHLIASHPFCAIGEIGIDLYWDTSYLAEQKHAFAQQMKWAVENQLPIVVHMRESFNAIKEVFDHFEEPLPRGVIHCFSGNEEQAQYFISRGFALGIGGIITFKNSPLAKVITQFSLANIVLETDSPYLAPVPFRGKRNESQYIVHIAQTIASLYQCSVETVAEQTTQTAKNIFGITTDR